MVKDMYLFYGTESFLINEEIKRIIKKENINDINIIKYDLENTKIEDIIEDASSISLFGDKKLIICYNSYIFTGVKNKIQKKNC